MIQIFCNKCIPLLEKRWFFEEQVRLAATTTAVDSVVAASWTLSETC